jgi:hypothetical protein
MHFNVIKNVVDVKFKFVEKLTFEGFHIIIIQKFKFQKMCFKVHNGSNINNTSFELFDLKKCNFTQSNKLAIDK